MWRSVLSVVAGFVVAAIVVGLLEAVSHQLFPPPAGINLHDPEQLKTIIDKLPPGAIVMVLVAWAVGSLAGGFVAALSANRNRLAHAGVVGCLQMLAGGITMLMIRHPTWFVIAAFLIVVPSALLGALLATLTLRSPPTGPRPYDMRQKNMAC